MQASCLNPNGGGSASSVLDQSDAAMSLPEEPCAQDDDSPPGHFGFIAQDKVLRLPKEQNPESNGCNKDLDLWFLIRTDQDHLALSCGATLTLS
ncbi:unnamed protein product, partial [Clonostachys byssicola]